MRSSLIIVLIVLGLCAPAFMIWMLLSGTESVSPSDRPVKNTPENARREEKRRRTITTPKEAAPPLQAPDTPSPLPEVRERVLPERALKGWHGTLFLVLHFPKGTAVPAPGQVRFKVYFEQVRMKASPKPEKRSGEYVLEELVPGRYRVAAYTTKGVALRGAASCRVGPGETVSVDLRLDRPRPILLKAVDGKTGKPVGKARIQWSRGGGAGVTDENGRYRSAAFFTPDTSRTALITHPRYFTTRFDPLHPERSGARLVGREGNAYRVPLPPRQGDLSLSGTLQDELERPLGRWIVHLYPLQGSTGKAAFLSAVTDREGRFHVEKLSPGPYLLAATLRLLALSGRAPPRYLFEEEVTLSEGAPSGNRIFTVERKRVPFHGRVLYTDPVKPAPGVRIECSVKPGSKRFADLSPPRFDPLFTDENGTFETSRTFFPEDLFLLIVDGGVPLLTPEGFSFTFRTARSAEKLVRLQEDLLEGRALTLWIANRTDLVLEGQVLDKDGAPLSLVLMSAESPTGLVQGQRRCGTDQDGRFRFVGLFPGVWCLSLLLPHGPTQEHVVFLHDQSQPPLMIRIPDTCELQGTVKGSPLPRRIWIHAEGPGYETDHIPVDSKGDFFFRYLPSGTSWVVLEYNTPGKKEGYGTLSVKHFEVELAPGKTTRLEIDL